MYTCNELNDVDDILKCIDAILSDKEVFYPDLAIQAASDLYSMKGYMALIPTEERLHATFRLFQDVWNKVEPNISMLSDSGWHEITEALICVFTNIFSEMEQRYKYDFTSEECDFMIRAHDLLSS